MTISKLASPYLMILTFSCYILACSTPKTTEPAKQFPIGDYKYVGYAEKGNRVV